MNYNTKTDPTVIIGTFAFTGTKAPKPVTDAHERMTKLRKASFGASRDGLGDAVAAAILADRDPASDPDVQRAITAGYLDNPGMTQHLETVAVGEFVNACSRHHEAIVTAWQKPYSEAVTALTVSHTRLQGVDLNDTAAILGLGADAAEVWARAQTEHRKVERIAEGWNALMTFLNIGLDRRYSLLRIADVDAPIWLDRDLTDKHLNPWDALTAGLSLSLPTLDEYRARVEAIKAAMAASVMPPVDVVREGNKAWASKVDAARETVASR